VSVNESNLLVSYLFWGTDDSMSRK